MKFLMNKSVMKKGALASLACLTLAACNNNPFEVVRMNCPAVAVVSNVGTFTHFVGEGRDTDDVAYNATISGVTSDCTQEPGTHMNMAFSVHVAKGPAFDRMGGGETVKVPYFVALMRDNHLITAKRIFEAEVRFVGDASRAGVREFFVQSFDDIEIARRYDYEVLIGFQLDAEDVTYTILR